MNCPHCASPNTKEQRKITALGYRTFRCSDCRRPFNEHMGTPFNFLEYPTDIVLLVVLWRLRYKLSLRDLAEMFLERGFVFTHEAVRDWEARFASLLTDQLRAKRRGQAGQSWYVDETYVNVKANWCYLYRAIDRDGNLVDSMLSETRDMEAAKRFFKQAVEVERLVLEMPAFSARFPRESPLLCRCARTDWASRLVILSSETIYAHTSIVTIMDNRPLSITVHFNGQMFICQSVDMEVYNGVW